MKAAPFDYHRPASLSEAARLLRELDDARLIAGGQSLVPMLNLRVAQPAHLVDLSAIASLAGVEDIGDRLVIGAMTTQRALERSALIAAHCPLISAALRHVGHQQTRNRGTIGGSLCHMDPAAELPVAAAALEAELTIYGSAGERMIPFADLPGGYLSTTLAADEILTKISIPKAAAGSVCAFQEFARRHGDFAIVSVAATLDVGSDGTVTRARIALGGIAAAPVRAFAAEQALVGTPFSAQTCAQALATLEALECDGDAVNPPAYRRRLARVLTERALNAAARDRNEVAHERA